MKKDGYLVQDLSFPLWGKWIERLAYMILVIYAKSFPLWGKWIESKSTKKDEPSPKVFPLVGKVD